MARRKQWRDRYGRWRDMPDAPKLFHVTAKRHRASIEREGLRVPKDGTPAVWAFNDRDAAEQLRGLTIGGATGADLDVWEIDAAGLDFKEDPHPGFADEPMRSTSVALDQPVPSSRLRIAEPPEPESPGRRGADVPAVRQKAAAWSVGNHPGLKSWPRAHQMPEEKYVAAASNHWRGVLDRSDLVIRLPEDIAEDVLHDGKFRNQHDTQDSQGLLAPATRAQAEIAAFDIDAEGYDPVLDPPHVATEFGMFEETAFEEAEALASEHPERFPVYGYFADRDRDPPIASADAGGAFWDSSANDIEQYGEIKLVLKPEVRERSYVVLGDSLGAMHMGFAPSRYERPQPYSATSDPMLQETALAHDSGRFNEALIFGGVNREDIAFAELPTEPSDDLIEALDEYDIPFITREHPQEDASPLPEGVPDPRPGAGLLPPVRHRTAVQDALKAKLGEPEPASPGRREDIFHVPSSEGPKSEQPRYFRVDDTESDVFDKGLAPGKEVWHDREQALKWAADRESISGKTVDVWEVKPTGPVAASDDPRGTSVLSEPIPTERMRLVRNGEEGVTHADDELRPWSGTRFRAIRARPEYEQRVARDRSKLVDRWAGEFGMTNAAYLQAVRQKLTDATKDADVNIRVPGPLMKAVVEDGRVKSQHETRTSGGMLAPSYREGMEADVFGVDPDDPKPEDRPIYGYLSKDEDIDGYSAVGQYGMVKLTLKPEVRQRTTTTWGDSLDAYQKPRRHTDEPFEGMTLAAVARSGTDGRRGLGETARPAPVDEPDVYAVAHTRPDLNPLGPLPGTVPGQIWVKDSTGGTVGGPYKDWNGAVAHAARLREESRQREEARVATLDHEPETLADYAIAENYYPSVTPLPPNPAGDLRRPGAEHGTWEVQVHGGVTLDDIESVQFVDGLPRGRTPVGGYPTERDTSIIDELDRRGIAWSEGRRPPIRRLVAEPETPGRELLVAPEATGGDVFAPKAWDPDVLEIDSYDAWVGWAQENFPDIEPYRHPPASDPPRAVYRHLAQAMRDASEDFPEIRKGSHAPLTNAIFASQLDRATLLKLIRLDGLSGWASTGRIPFIDPDGTVLLVNDVTDPTPERLLRPAESDRGMVGKASGQSAYGAFLHEMAHAASYASGFETTKDTENDMLAKYVDWFEEEDFKPSDAVAISQYAASHPAEALAEAYAAWKVPGGLDDLTPESAARVRSLVESAKRRFAPFWDRLENQKLVYTPKPAKVLPV